MIAKLSIYFKSKKVFLIDKNKYKLKNGVSDKKIIKLSFNQLKKKIKIEIILNLYLLHAVH